LVETDEVCETYSDVPHLFAIPMKIKRKIHCLVSYVQYRVMLLKQIHEICTKANNIYTMK